MATTPIDFSAPWPDLWQQCKAKYPLCFSDNPPSRPFSPLRLDDSRPLSRTPSPFLRPLSPLRGSPPSPPSSLFNSSRRSSTSSSPAPQTPTAADYPPAMRPPHLFPLPPPEAFYQAPWPLPAHIDINSPEAFIMGCQAAKRTADAKAAMTKWEQDIRDEIWGINEQAIQQANQNTEKQAPKHACRKCPEVFPSRNKLHAHVRAQHGKQPPQAPQTSPPLPSPFTSDSAASDASIPSTPPIPSTSPPPSRS